jgi:hypothetical protein
MSRESEYPFRALRHLMSLGLGILALQRVLATPAPLGLDRDHDIDLCHRHQRPRLPVMAGLPARPTSSGLAARPFRRLGRIGRWWLGGVARVASQSLGQLCDRRLPLRDFRLPLSEHRGLRHNQLPRDGRRLLPYLRG